MHQDIEHSHYLRSVTALGDRHRVLAHRDIVSHTGLKLVAKGTRVTSAMFDHLVHHKLLPDIDHCLEVENAVTADTLAAGVVSRIDAEPLLSRVLGEELEGVREIVAGIPLTLPMAVKMTVAREQHAAIYTHSLIVTAFALDLGLRAGLPAPALRHLAAAALFHDIGLLHIDPDLFTSGHVMSAAERNYLYAHPIIAYLILKEFPQYHPEVSTAVLEHHERLDASGYPRGLGGAHLGTLAKILMVAEVAASRCDAGGQCRDMHRLAIILRLNTHKLATEYTNLLHPYYRGQTGPLHADYRLLLGPYTLAQLLLEWRNISRPLIDAPGGEAEHQMFAFVAEQIDGLHRALLYAGFNPDDIEPLMADADSDGAYLNEIKLLANEAYWQIRDLCHEITRRWPTLHGSGPAWEWLEKARALVAEQPHQDTRPP